MFSSSSMFVAAVGGGSSGVVCVCICLCLSAYICFRYVLVCVGEKVNMYVCACVFCHLYVHMQEVVTATIDLEDIRSYRGGHSGFQKQVRELCT